jgi:hypothetical protein
MQLTDAVTMQNRLTLMEGQRVTASPHNAAPPVIDLEDETVDDEPDRPDEQDVDPGDDGGEPAGPAFSGASGSADGRAVVRIEPAERPSSEAEPYLDVTGSDDEAGPAPPPRAPVGPGVGAATSPTPTGASPPSPAPAAAPSPSPPPPAAVPVRPLLRVPAADPTASASEPEQPASTSPSTRPDPSVFGASAADVPPSVGHGDDTERQNLLRPDVPFRRARRAARNGASAGDSSTSCV